ncbi:MAG: hypothetical protein JOY90_18660 [Bradyrhizobium sp.]|uniref:hypothetical protein n=1 Tax=Bradyrhizobium sp. TaxID=376 RepID=UPI001DFD620E|nr:hypothetical protein [Bradyrhizobium sp.]MBV9562441.1 hypothetical protein [Bradyrhizobium sp.]
MTEQEKAQRVLETLQAAEAAEPKAALAMLNGLMELVRSPSSEESLEADEARSAAFLSICEVGKALHRGQPAEPLWAGAVAATERWVALSRRR